MQKPLPDIGARTGLLSVAGYIPRRWPDARERLWCFCECGGETMLTLQVWRRGGFLHCGCVTVIRQPGDPDKMAARGRWASMLKRCRDPKSDHFKNYGGRGIKVCKRWESFDKFLKDVGPRPSMHHTLDRIDNDGDYKKSNVRWTTRSRQQVNRRNVKMYELHGESLSITDWSRRHHLNPVTVQGRMLRGASLEQALVPLGQYKSPLPSKRVRYVFLEYEGRKQALVDWAKELGIPDQTLRNRLANGYSVHQAITSLRRKTRAPDDKRVKGKREKLPCKGRRKQR